MLIRKFRFYFDGDAGEGGKGGSGGGDGGGAGGTGDPSGSKSGEVKTYTEEEVQSIIKNERQREQEKTRAMIGELDQLKKNKNLTEQEKQTLESKIDELKNSLLTKEELAAKEKEKLTTQHKADIEKLTGERDNWRNLFQLSSIQRAISDAAIANEAFSPEQISAILLPHTRLHEETDDQGTPSGKFTPKVKLTEMKDGKETILDLTVDDAVKRMKDTPEKYGNLFKSNAQGGLGLGENIRAGRPTDVKNMSPDEYQKRRKKMGAGAGLVQ